MVPVLDVRSNSIRNQAFSGTVAVVVPTTLPAPVTSCRVPVVVILTEPCAAAAPIHLPSTALTDGFAVM